MKHLLFSLTIVILLTALTAMGQIPQTISYQGVLTDNNGTLVPEGDYSISFNLYNVSTEGSSLWTETQTVTITNGIFNVKLGEVNPLDLPFDEVYWLGIIIDGGTELSPRIEFTSSAYSLNAGSVKGENNIFPADGNVGIGTVEPAQPLHVHGQAFIEATGTTAGRSALEIKGDPGYGAGLRIDNGSQTWSIVNWSDQTLKFVKLSGGTFTPFTIYNTTFQDALVLADSGVGIGLNNPVEKFQVDGTIYSMNGGFRFPDGTVQTTAAFGGGGGDITSIAAGMGLYGGGNSGDVALHVLGGTGLSVGDSVRLYLPYTDGRYVNETQANSVTSAMITDGAVANTDLASNAVTQVKIANNAVTAAKISPNIVSSIDGVSNDGGNIDLLAGSNISIVPNNTNNTITISSSGGTGGGDITAVTAGSGLTGGGESADVVLNVGAGNGITATADEIVLDETYTDVLYVNENQNNSISSAMIQDNAVSAAKISIDVVSSIDGVSNDGGDIDLIAGNNVTITPDNINNRITISASGGDGDITAVSAGNGLTGGAASGDATLDIGAGTGINVSADAIALNTIYTDGRYVNQGQTNSVTSLMIANDQVNADDIAANAVSSSEVINNSLTAADLNVNLVSSVDGVTNDGGNIDLVAGSNITITPDDPANTITISATAQAGNTLDQAYDQGAAGAGRTITADAGAVNIEGTDGLTVEGNIGIGTTTPVYPISVFPGTSTRGLSIVHNQTGAGHTYGVHIALNKTSTDNSNVFGMYSTVTNNNGTNNTFGVSCLVTGTSAGPKYGVRGYAYGSGPHYGVYGHADGVGTQYGVFGNATGTGTLWAGYFTGNVYAGGRLGIGTPLPTAELHVGGENGALFTGTFSSGTIPVEGAGTRMMWYPGKAAFRAGEVTGTTFWDDDSIGNHSFAAGYNTTASDLGATAMGVNSSASGYISTALGYDNTASGYTAVAMGNGSTASGSRSTALGRNSIASGNYSIAIGYTNTASGDYSTATGRNNEASGDASTAMGYNTTASGGRSTAMGYNTTASGFLSTAMGANVSTSGTGSMIIGDNSTTTILTRTINNAFYSRFAAGYYLYTNSGTTVGAFLGVGANSWGTISDSTKKENFKQVNGEDILTKISKFKLSSWNYKDQDPTKFRHYGPMAQDFYTAFGDDGIGTIGNDTTLSSSDFAGINFIAIQALEIRTTELKEKTKEIEKLRKDFLSLKEENKELKQKLVSMASGLKNLEILFTKYQNQNKEADRKYQ